MNNKLEITLMRKSNDKVGTFYASAENVDLSAIGKKLNALKVRCYSYDVTKDAMTLIFEPPKPEFADKVAKPFHAKDGNGVSTGMWTNKTAKGFVTATGGALDIAETIAALGGTSSVSVALFRNQNKTDAEGDKKPHWNLKLSKFVPKQRTQPAQASSSDRPM